MIKKLQNIYRIIPEEFQKKSLRYLLLSMFNIFLDLVSVAYLIPLFIFILDKDQMPEFLKKITFFNEANLLFWVMGIIFLFILKNIIQIAIIRFQSSLVFEVATKLSGNLTHRFLQNSYGQIQQLDKGKEIQKIQMSGTDFANHILLSLNAIFTELSVIIVIALVSLFLYPYFSLYIFLIAFICLFLIYHLRKKKVNKIGRSIKKLYSTSTSHLLNIIDGFLEIKSLGKEEFFQKQYHQTLSEFNTNIAELKNHQNSNTKFLEIAIILALSLFLFYLNTSFNLMSGKVLLISYVAGISLKLFPSLNKLIVAFTNFRSYQYTLDILQPFSNNFENKPSIVPFKNHLELRDVSFSFSNNHQLLSHINITLEKGKITGIKGRSGIGKTTLLNIIMGLLEPQSGEIIIDKNPVKHLQSYPFKFVGYVPQQPFLFQGSLIENIVMDEDKKQINFSLINELIDALSLREFVSRLPSGLDTLLSHDSLQVSGGQKQRIALIRALYANPKLLILDEVTNQLDENLEENVLQFIKNYTLKNNIAVVLVSHSPLMNSVCDAVFEINQFSLNKIA